MLNILRKKTKIIVSTIVVLIIPAFVLFGVSSAISKKRANNVGKIFGKRVPIDEYNNAFTACKINAMMLYGEFYNKIAKNLDFSTQIWERLILIKEAKKRGLSVSKQELLNTLENYPFFQYKGKFSKKLYEYMVAKFFNTHPQNYEIIEKDNILIKKLLAQILDGIFVSDEEAFAQYQFQNNKIKAKYILFLAKDFEKDVKFNEAQAIEFYDNNKSLFKTQEQRQINYIKIPYSEFKVEVTDDEINSYYEKNKASFEKTDKTTKDTKTDKTDKPKEYKPLSEVKDTISADLKKQKQRDLANEKFDNIIEELLDNNAIDLIAKKYNVIYETSPLLVRYRSSIPTINPADSNKLIMQGFNLELGETSDVIYGDKNAYVVKLTNIIEPFVAKFELVKEQIDEALTKQLSIKLANTAGENLRNKLISLTKTGSSFEEAAAKLELTVKETPLFTISSSIKDIGYSEDFTKQAFSLKQGEISNIITVSSGTLFLTPLEKKKITKQEFEKDTNLKKFKEGLLNKKQRLIYETWFKAIKEKANIQINEKAFRKE